MVLKNFVIQLVLINITEYFKKYRIYYYIFRIYHNIEIFHNSLSCILLARVNKCIFLTFTYDLYIFLLIYLAGRYGYFIWST